MVVAMNRRRMDLADLGPAAREQALAATGEQLSEEGEQRQLIAWADGTALPAWVPAGDTIGDYLLAIPNGGARYRAEGGKLKAQGVRPGVPDLFLALPLGDQPGLWIELKRARGGGPSPAQREWLERLAVAGYSVCCCHGWQDARDQILAYLENAR